MTLNKFAFRRIVLLLICPALLITLIGNAVALDSVSQDPATATQTHSASIDFTGSGGTTYILDQDQSAAITSGDGVINQYGQSSGTVSTHGPVTIGTATGGQVQNVYTTDSSATPTSNVVSTYSSATPTSNVVSTGPGAVIAGSSANSGSNVVRIISTPTDVGGSIQASQGQTQSGVDISQQQTGSTMTINTPGRNIGIIRMQQKIR